MRLAEETHINYFIGKHHQFINLFINYHHLVGYPQHFWMLVVTGRPRGTSAGNPSASQRLGCLKAGQLDLDHLDSSLASASAHQPLDTIFS